MKIDLLKIGVALICFFSLSSCLDNNDEVEIVNYSLKVNMPSDLQSVDASGLSVTFKNTLTGSVQTVSTNSEGIVAFTGLPGVYNMEVTGQKTYSFINSNGETIQRTVSLAGIRENVALSAVTASLSIDALIQIDNKGWVIKEIYFSGCKTPSGGNYYKDQFVELYNNTDSILYADGISIAQSANNTQSQETNIYASEFGHSTYVNTVYTIPGNGKEVPVQPGKSILIAPQPINHNATNTNSLDLSVADYQWYDNHATLSIDVPEVPNLIKNYSYSATIWILHVSGYNSFIVFRGPQDMTSFVTSNTDIRNGNNGKPTTAIRIPNEYILDAVELGSKTDFKSKAMSSSLDISYTYCSVSYSGKSIRRKVERVEEDGRVVYKDTNNSALDFIPDATPMPKVFTSGNN